MELGRKGWISFFILEIVAKNTTNDSLKDVCIVDIYILWFLLLSAGPQPTSGGPGSPGPHHPQTDRPPPGSGPERFTSRAAGPESTGIDLIFSIIHPLFYQTKL